MNQRIVLPFEKLENRVSFLEKRLRELEVLIERREDYEREQRERQ